KNARFPGGRMGLAATRTAVIAGMMLGTSGIAAGATLGTKTITNANHAGGRGSSGNTVVTFAPSATPGTIRRIDYTGTLTKVAADTWAKEARVSPTLGGLAVSQNYLQFSPIEDY